MSTPQIDAGQLAAMQQMMMQYFATMFNTSPGSPAQGAGTTFNPLSPDFLATQSSQQVNQIQQNQAYLLEIVRLEIATIVRNSQIQGKQIADFALFKDPAFLTLGPGINPTTVPTGQQLSYQDATGATHTFPTSNLINLELFQLGIGQGTAGSTPLQFLNRVTGNGMVIEDGKIKTIVDGKETSSANLAELFGITAENKTGSLMLETGVKVQFEFDVQEGQEPVLKKLFITHPDGSFAEVTNLNDPNAQVQTNSGQQLPEILKYLDEQVKDGKTFFMSPEGLSLQQLDLSTNEFVGVFGDQASLALGLKAASFGGNLVNFYYSETDQGFHAQQLIAELIPGFDPSMFAGMGFDPSLFAQMGFDPSMLASMGFDPSMFANIPGFDPSVFAGIPGWDQFFGGQFPGTDCGCVIDTPPGFCVPPQYYGYFQNKLHNGSSVEDLIFENLTGVDKGSFSAAKKAFLQKQLKYGNLDLETKLMLVLYLFLEDNDDKTNDILGQLSGVDINDKSGKKTYKQYNVNNIDKADLQTQMEFWSNYKPAGLSTNQATRQEQLQSNATMVNGKMQGLQIDQSLLTTRLTNLIRDRQRFVEAISNIMKSLDDALSNAIRRIV